MIIIIGAGLSGLLTAYRLKKAGIPFIVLEARNRIGGRIHTLKGKDDTPIEMGATWFNTQHRYLIQLLEELDIPYFIQYMKGAAFFHHTLNSPADIINLPQDEPSYRISGGTSNLINTLYNKLEKGDILFNQSVTSIKSTAETLIVEANESYKAEKVVLAIPPKLWKSNISFDPALPTDLTEIAKHTHTWMEDSIKVALVYDTPFWKDKDQSGTLFSNFGPLTEFYDHCNIEESKYALCGFMNPSLQQYSLSQRKEMIIEQLQNTFGEDATKFIEYNECIWREEPNTYTSSETPLQPHQNNGNPIFSTNQLDDRLIFSSTEVSPHFGCYMEGAVFIADIVAKKLKENSETI